MSSRAKKSVNPALRSVATIPGAMPLTRTPRCRYSAANALVSMRTPPFEAAYAAFHGLPTMPETDVVLTITPPPPSSMCGRRVPADQEGAPQVHRDDVVEHGGLEGLGPIELADAGDVAHHGEPAELGEGEVDRPGDGTGVGDVALVVPGVTTGGHDLRCGGVVSLHVEARDPCALRREAERRRPTDARPRAGDDRPRLLVPALAADVFHVQTRSRSSYLSTLPLALTGNASSTTARRGTL